MDLVRRSFERVRRPEYTGENRCLPCTLLNVFIASLLAVAVGLVLAPAVGALVLGIGLFLIAVRGYLVPKTPALTARYLPSSVLRWFGKDEPVYRAASASEQRAQTDVEALLRDAGVVELDPADDDLRLTDRFRVVWWRRIRRFREAGAIAQLATILDVDPETLSVSSREDTGYMIVTFEDEEIGRWVSEAAFYADLAVEPALREWLPEWEAIGDDRRTAVIAGLRAFLESCPLCESELESVEDVRRSCCSSSLVNVTVDCEACGARVFTGSYR